MNLYPCLQHGFIDDTVCLCLLVWLRQKYVNNNYCFKFCSDIHGPQRIKFTDFSQTSLVNQHVQYGPANVAQIFVVLRLYGLSKWLSWTPDIFWSRVKCITQWIAMTFVSDIRMSLRMICNLWWSLNFSSVPSSGQKYNLSDINVYIPAKCIMFNVNYHSLPLCPSSKSIFPRSLRCHFPFIHQIPLDLLSFSHCLIAPPI